MILFLRQRKTNIKLTVCRFKALFKGMNKNNTNF